MKPRLLTCKAVRSTENPSNTGDSVAKYMVNSNKTYSWIPNNCSNLKEGSPVNKQMVSCTADSVSSSNHDANARFMINDDNLNYFPSEDALFQWMSENYPNVPATQ